MDKKQKPDANNIEKNDFEGLLQQLEPFDSEPVKCFAPGNGDEQKRRFLDGEIDSPGHVYPEMASMDFPATISRIESVVEQILDRNIQTVQIRDAYANFARFKLLIAKLEQAAYQFKTSASYMDQKKAAKDFMFFNIELYGEPDVDTYHQLLAGEIQGIQNKELSGEAAKIREDLIGSVDSTILENSPSKYKPTQQTMEQTHSFANVVYEDLLKHIPDEQERDTFNAEEIQAIFADIITDEFGVQAEGWRVEIDPNKSSIDVSPRERLISIPEQRKVSRDTLRGLICHELGVHMMRSLMGEQTDFSPLRTGLSGYYPSEEGLGKVMEQALTGEYSESGVQYQIIAGAAYFDHKSRRECFELIRKIKILSSLPDGSSDIPEDITRKSDNLAYNNVQRIFRGTDELPLFKDLAYYNGSTAIWRYLDGNLTDDASINAEIFIRIFAGKQDINNQGHIEVMHHVSPSEEYDLAA